MSNDELRELLEGMKHAKMNYLEKLRRLKSAGVRFEWDNGRDIDDAISLEEAAVGNIDRAIRRLS